MKSPIPRIDRARIVLLDFILAWTIICAGLVPMLLNKFSTDRRLALASAPFAKSGYWRVAAVEAYAVTGNTRFQANSTEDQRDGSEYAFELLPNGVRAVPQTSSSLGVIEFHSESTGPGPSYMVDWNCYANRLDEKVVPAVCGQEIVP